MRSGALRARARRALRDVGDGGRRRRGGRRPRRCRWARSPSARCARCSPTRRASTALEAARDAVARRAARASVAAALDRLDRVFEEVTGRPAARARGRQRRRPDGRLPRLHARPRRDARPGGARRAARLAAARCSTPRAGGAGACSTAAPRCSGGSPHGRSGPLAPMLGAADGRGLRALEPDGRRAARAAAPLGLGRRRRARRRRLRRLDARVARLGLPLRRPADRRGEHRRGGARRLPDRARRLPRRRQPARPGPVRAPPPRSRRDAAPDRRGGRAGRPPLPAAPRRGRDDRAQLADVPRGRHRRGGRRRARARRHAPRRARGRRRRRRPRVRPRGELPRAARRSSSTCRSSSPRCAASIPSATARDARRSAASSCAARTGRRERAELPAAAEDLAAWARERGLPRRVFARSPLERKPRYVDFESPSLRRTLTRFLAPAREHAPDAPVEFTEMLPGPEECWLESDAGHHTSELRVVAVDRLGHPDGCGGSEKRTPRVKQSP